MEQKEIRQEPLTEEPQDINFDNDGSQSVPLAPGRGFGIRDLLEWSFERMRPKEKKKVFPVKPANIPKTSVGLYQNPPYKELAHQSPIPKDQIIENGLLMQKKSFIEKARDQLKFPWLKSIPNITKGLAAIILVIGTMAIYAEIPSHPGIVVGIVLVSLASSLIISSR